MKTLINSTVTANCCVMRCSVMWSNVFSHVDKGRFLFLIYFYEGVFNEKTKDI